MVRDNALSLIIARVYDKSPVIMHKGLLSVIVTKIARYLDIWASEQIVRVTNKLKSAK